MQCEHYNKQTTEPSRETLPAKEKDKPPEPNSIPNLAYKILCNIEPFHSTHNRDVLAIGVQVMD
jgi:hypothetical protein